MNDVSFVLEVFMERRDLLRQGELKLFRIWAQQGYALPHHRIPRIEFDRLIHREQSQHAPLECFFYGWQPIYGVYYSIIPEPGDAIAYSVPASEWNAFFDPTNDQGLEWYSRASQRFIGRPISEEEAERLSDVDIVTATPRIDSYLVYINLIGFRILCAGCAAKYCQFSSVPLF